MGRSDKSKQRNRERAARHYYANRERKLRYQWEYHLRHAYGLTLADYHALILLQGGRCALCHDPLDGVFDVDHDHETGKVRGLLCRTCNTGLGHLERMLPSLEQIKEYLKKGRG